MTYYVKFLIFLIVISATGIYSQAQDELGVSDIYVTTQDFAKLREGPGKNWGELATLDFGVTLQATGRSVDGQWIQVLYDGAVSNSNSSDTITYGWIAYWLLAWTGDILELPIDGVETVRSARQSGPLITINSDTLYYVDGIDPSTRVLDTVDSPQTVEVTGRVGSANAGFFWIQFEYEGNYYWTGSWEIGEPQGYLSVADGSSVFPYGRLLTQLQQTFGANQSNWRTISQRWYDLDAGFQTTCNNIPPLTVLRQGFFSSADVDNEPEFIAVVQAMTSLIENMNNATTLFNEVCNREDGQRFATAEDVDLAITYIDEANRQLNIVRLFLTPLERRNPLLSNDN